MRNPLKWKNVTWDAERACAAAIKNLIYLGKSFGKYSIEFGFPPQSALGRKIAEPIEIVKFPEVASLIRQAIERFYNISVHLPMCWNLSSLNEEERERHVKKHIELIKYIYLTFGIKNFVLHPGDGQLVSANTTAEEINRIKKAGLESLKEIINELSTYPIVLGIENLAPKEGSWNVNDFSHLLGMHADLRVGWVLDNLHALACGLSIETICTLIKLYKDHIVEIHLNDGAESYDPKHSALFTGKAGVSAVIYALKQIEYKGRIIIEVDWPWELIKSQSNLINYFKSF